MFALYAVRFVLVLRYSILKKGQVNCCEVYTVHVVKIYKVKLIVLRHYLLFIFSLKCILFTTRRYFNKFQRYQNNIYVQFTHVSYCTYLPAPSHSQTTSAYSPGNNESKLTFLCSDTAISSYIAQFSQSAGHVTQFYCISLNTAIQWSCGDLNFDRISS